MVLTETEWANQLQHDCDVVIVGSGAAGISLALELSKSGIHSILLEGGDNSFTEESQDCYKGLSSGHNLPFGLSGSRLRFFGGSTNCWAGGCGELDDQDFLNRSWISSSGWPINKEDLNAYYHRAADFLQIDINRIRKPSEIAGLPTLDGFELRSLEYTPKVRFSEAFGGLLKKNSLIKVLINANLTKINRSANGDSVLSIKIESFRGAKSLVKGKFYVLACGGVENPRILLNSEDLNFHAFGNHTDMVGRFFCDHPIAPCATVIGEQGEVHEMKWEERAFWKPNKSGQISAPFYRMPYHLQEKYKILNAAIQFHLQDPELGDAEIAAWQIKNYFNDSKEFSLSTKDMLAIAESPIELIQSIRNRQLKAGLRIAMRFQIEQAPNAESRIMLVDDRDSLGIRRIKLSWKFSEIERRTVDVLTAYTAKCLQDQKIGTLKFDKELVEHMTDLPRDLRGGQHHSCTTRMASTDKEGVVDSNLRVFHTKNLFICGSSVFPTNGWVNPTMTIIALSIRLASHLVDCIHSQ